MPKPWYTRYTLCKVYNMGRMLFPAGCSFILVQIDHCLDRAQVSLSWQVPYKKKKVHLYSSIPGVSAAIAINSLQYCEVGAMSSQSFLRAS